MRRRRTAVLATTAIVGTGAAIGVGAAMAAIPGPDGVIHGCYNTTTGALRVITGDKGKTPACQTGEASLNWNQTGPRGPAGSGGSDISATQIVSEEFSVAAATTVEQHVLCPFSLPIATGGGVTLELGTIGPPGSDDHFTDDGHIVASIPVSFAPGINQVQPNGWSATVRNETGRPFNGRTIHFRLSVDCAPGHVVLFPPPP